MAIATLDHCFNNRLLFTGVVKIRKGMAAKLLLNSSTLEEVRGWFLRFTGSLLAKARTRSAEKHPSKVSEAGSKTQDAAASLLEILQDDSTTSSDSVPGPSLLVLLMLFCCFTSCVLHLAKARKGEPHLMPRFTEPYDVAAVAGAFLSITLMLGFTGVSVGSNVVRSARPTELTKKRV